MLKYLKTPLFFKGLILTLLGGLFIFQGCNSDPFPVGERTGGRFQVPLVPTYTFNFKTGTSEILGTLSNLRIVSGADVKNLITAVPGTAEQSADLGVLSGVVVDRLGRPLPSVSIGGTDKAGRIIRNIDGSVKGGVTNADGELVASILFNGINGIPEFINTTGTAVSGSFTALNVPPGQHFVKAVQGGRGNGRVNIYAGSVSLLDMSVFPVALPTSNIAGVVRERDKETGVGPSQISFPGLAGSITTTGRGAFSASGLGSESVFLSKVAAAGHIDTYQTVFTDLADLTANAVTPEITIDFSSVANQDVQQLVLAAGASLISGRGMLLGNISEAVGIEGNVGRKDGAVVIATDAEGNPIGETFYFPTGSDFPVCNNASISGCQVQTSTEGIFLILNLPPGDVYLKAYAVVDATDGSGLRVKSTGNALASVFPNSLTLLNMRMETALRVDPASVSALPPTWYTVGLSGTVLEEDGLTPVGGVSMRVMGLSEIFANSDAATGTYAIAAGTDSEAIAPLLANNTILIRLEKSGGTHVTTYQSVNTGGQDLNLDLTLVSNGFIGATNGSGAILGRVINRRLGGRNNEVQLLTTQMIDQNGHVMTSGNPVGNISYFNAAGVLDFALTETTDNGLFLIRNIPPGLVMLKTAGSDDSGNQIIRVFPDSVHKVDIALNHVPLNVPVRGNLSDLHNHPVSGAALSLLGERSRFTSESLTVSPGVPIPANGSFLTKVVKNGFIDTYNDQLKTGLNPQTDAQFYVTSEPELSQLAVQAGVSLDLQKGLVAGEVVAQTIVDAVSTLSTGSGVKAMTAGFFNEDVYPDVAVVHAPDQVQIFLGQANGGFIPATPASIGVENDPAAIAAGDFNQDGFTDLVVVNRGSNSISRLWGTGNGAFSTLTPITAGLGTAPGHIKVADLNRDGRLDLVIANEGSNNLSVLVGDGRGGFSVNNSPCPTPCAVAGSPTGIATGDFNDDNILDLAVATNSGVVSLLWSGDGSINTALVAGDNPSDIGVGDFNADGLLDIVVLNAGSDDLSIFKGDGNDRFDKVDCFPGPNPATDPINENCPLTPGTMPRALLVLDFEQDGTLDIVIANEGSGTLSVVAGKGDGRFDLPSKSFTVGSAPKALLMSDLNQDGHNDLIALNSGSDNLSILLSQRSSVKDVLVDPRDLDGNPVGVVRYLNDALDVDPLLNQTGNSGRFIIFDLPFGLNILKGTRNAVSPSVTPLTGNSLVNITAFNSLFYTHLNVDTGMPGNVTAVGVTCRVVGETCTKVGQAEISFLGSRAEEFCPPGPKCISNEVGAQYAVRLDPNSTYVVRMLGPDADLPGDSDGDGVPDQIDNCANIANPDQVDVNGNDIGDACELSILDGDGDGFNDDVDNCPFVANFGQEDDDRDGIGNACDGIPSGKPVLTKPTNSSRLEGP